MGVFLVLAFLSQRHLFKHQRHLFKHLKTRLSPTQIGLLDAVVRTRARVNSVLYNVKFLEEYQKHSVAPRGIQHRVRKAKVHHSHVHRASIREG